MRRTMGLMLLLLATLALSGCLSTGFLGFLATTKQMNKALEERDTQIAALKSELAEYRTLKTDTEQAVKQMVDAYEKVETLEASAKQTEERFATLPADTIRRIVEILQAALQ